MASIVETKEDSKLAEILADMDLEDSQNFELSNESSNELSNEPKSNNEDFNDPQNQMFQRNSERDLIEMTDFFNQETKGSPKLQEEFLTVLTGQPPVGLGFTYISKTQYQTLPILLNHFNYNDKRKVGNSCVIQGPAGTGKTMSFILGTMPQIDYTSDKTQVLVISPDRVLAEQNRQNAELFCWKSEKRENQLIYEYKDCNCDGKKKRNCIHDKCGKIKESRFENFSIYTEKLVGKMDIDWKEVLANPNFKAHYVCIDKNIMCNKLLKKKKGKYTPKGIKLLSDVRMVVVDEADCIWKQGGFEGFFNDFIKPLCTLKAKHCKDQENKKIQFIFCSATFNQDEKEELSNHMQQLKQLGFANDFHEVRLSNRELLKKNISQYYVPCENYAAKYEALYEILDTIKRQKSCKSVLIIPMGGDRSNGPITGNSCSNQSDEMEEIALYLKGRGLQKVGTLSAKRKAKDGDNKKRILQTKDGEIYRLSDSEVVETLENFKDQSVIKYLVTTMIKRGIDIPSCSHVILFGMATQAYDSVLENEYLQNIGRCGRKGIPGVSINLINRPKELKIMKEIEVTMDMKAAGITIKRAPGWSATDEGIPKINTKLQGGETKDGEIAYNDEIEEFDGTTQEETKDMWKDLFKNITRR